MNYQVYLCEDCKKNPAFADSVRRTKHTGNTMCFHYWHKLKYPEGIKRENTLNFKYINANYAKENESTSET